MILKTRYVKEADIITYFIYSSSITFLQEKALKQYIININKIFVGTVYLPLKYT